MKYLFFLLLFFSFTTVFCYELPSELNQFSTTIKGYKDGDLPLISEDLEAVKSGLEKVQQPIELTLTVDDDLEEIEVISQTTALALQSLIEVPYVDAVAEGIAGTLESVNTAVKATKTAIKPVVTACKTVKPQMEKSISFCAKTKSVVDKTHSFLTQVPSVINYFKNWQHTAPQKQQGCVANLFHQSNSAFGAVQAPFNIVVSDVNKYLTPMKDNLTQLKTELAGFEHAAKPISQFLTKMDGLKKVTESLKRDVNKQVTWVIRYPKPTLKDPLNKGKFTIRFSVKKTLKGGEHFIQSIFKGYSKAVFDELKLFGLDKATKKVLNMAKKAIEGDLETLKKYKNMAVPEFQKMFPNLGSALADIQKVERGLQSIAKDYSKNISVPSDQYLSESGIKASCSF